MECGDVDNCSNFQHSRDTSELGVQMSVCLRLYKVSVSVCVCVRECDKGDKQSLLLLRLSF